MAVHPSLLSIAASLRTASDLSPFDLDPSTRTQLSELTDTEFPDLASSLVDLTRTEKSVLSLAPTSFFDTATNTDPACFRYNLTK